MAGEEQKPTTFQTITQIKESFGQQQSTTTTPQAVNKLETHYGDED